MTDSKLPTTELSKAAQQTAIDEHSQFLAEQFDGEATIEDAKQAFNPAGFSIERVCWSGFSSQGDGACFEGSWRAKDVAPGGVAEYAPIDAELHRIAAGIEAIAAKFPFASFTVKNCGHHSHEYCTEFDVSICNEDGDEIETPEREQAEKNLIELARDAMRWTYRQLEKEYDWTMADEQVRESIEANGYEYTEDGKID